MRQLSHDNNEQDHGIGGIDDQAFRTYDQRQANISGGIEDPLMMTAPANQLMSNVMSMPNIPTMQTPHAHQSQTMG